ncbi:MAG: transcriptional repressor [Deltaproteobacteria bacterium]|nr:transcriptional repressor [Deltaproteobacteria bacterium]
MSNFVESALHSLKQSGFRLTEQRRAVLEVLANARIPLTPTEVHQRIKGRGRSMDLVSVYRILETFEQNGLVHHVLAGNTYKACSHYFDSGDKRHSHDHDRAHEGHHCHHLAICTQCGKSYEFACPELAAIASQVSQQSGIQISKHILELQGTCKTCQPG